MTEQIPELMEAIWETGEQFDRRLSVSDRVALGRELARSSGAVTPKAVKEAFKLLRLATPSTAYAIALVSRIQRLSPKPSLQPVLVDYRHFAIQSLSGQFGGKTGGREEELKNNLLTFLRPRGFTEARTGRGRMDIFIPSLNTVIEVKVWSGVAAYEDGLEELSRYIHTERPSQAFMVVFCEREPLPSILTDHRQAIAEMRELQGLLVPVVVVPFEVDQPSKAASRTRRRARNGR